MRSLLFVPGDSEKKLEKGLHSGADVLIIDLEDSVSLANKPAARHITLAFLREKTAQAARLGQKIFVRVNALSTGETEADLAAIMAGAPYGIMLPKSESGADVQHLGSLLAVQEAHHGLLDGATKIIAIATETAQGIFGMSSYKGASRRLLALTWGCEDLSADIGARQYRDAAGVLTPPFALARSLTIFAAASAGVLAIDTVFPNFKAEEAFEAEAEAALRDGFSAKMAIHPAQVAPIHAVFTPSEAALSEARAIIAAFAASPNAGVLSLNGKMIDQPHLRLARRMLGL